VIDNPFVEETINKIRRVQQQMDEAEARGDKKTVQKLHDEKSDLKKSLPAWLFCVSHIEKTERKPFGKPMVAAWRKAEHAKLNGLCFLDIDGISEPEKAFAKVVETYNSNTPSPSGEEGGEAPSWCGAFCKHYGILLVHVTPSGKGLRFVFKADPGRGNLADNQAWLASVLGMQMDAVCKDSVRISFGCTRRDIIYIELENLLNYENEEFEKRFGEDYRAGRSMACGDAAVVVDHAASNGSEGNHEADRVDEGNAGADESARRLVERDEEGNPIYRGVPYKDIADAWMCAEYGHLPAVGERNAAYYSLVQGCMRYICDFNEDMVLAATPDYGLSEQERRQCARSAIGARRYAAIPRKLVAFLETVGVASTENQKGIRRSNENASGLADWDFEGWTKRFAPWFESPVWAPVCSVLPRYSRLNGILAAGSMFGTLLSGCRLLNWYDGSDLALTYMTYIIGDAGTGKGDYRELDRLIMEPLRLEDARGRKAEENYQAEMKRLQMAKAKKDDIPEEKHFPVRYLPTDTTLKQKLERCMDALNTFGTEQRQVACYNFESELSSKINYEKSSWNSSQDFDKKSFDCELTGSESRSSMTRNGLVPAFFNFVVTGTPDALQKKITLRNCLDGLPTRLIMGVQWGQKYQMLKREMRRRPDKDSDWLRTVGNRLLRCGWDVDLEQRVAVPKRWQDHLGKSTSFADALYYWGKQKAFALSLEDDSLGDYFRKRPPLIAVRLAAVDAIMNSLDTFEETGKLNLKFSSIELALNLADYIFESQLWFFGKLVEEALEGVPVQGGTNRKSKHVEAFNSLGDTITAADVMKVLNVVNRTAQNILSLWYKDGYIERISKNNYKKTVKILL
jgi:hypothetical protein